MLTLEELKTKLNKEYKGFKLSGVVLDGEYVRDFTLSREVGDEALVYCYFWESNFNSYISYFV